MIPSPAAKDRETTGETPIPHLQGFHLFLGIQASVLCVPGGTVLSPSHTRRLLDA